MAEVTERIQQLLQQLNHPSLPGIELSLGRLQRLLEALGNPQDKLPPTIHVAGTNGKGSTIAYLKAIYEAAGLRVHIYTSPHLVRFNERIVLAGEQISDAALLPYLEQVAKLALGDYPVTYFEATTAAAFLAFAEHSADLLILEVGMGGRLDATNLAGPVVASVITPIGIDHREFLGQHLADIAAEKAGIMRKGVPCVMAPQAPEALEVLVEKAQAVQASLIPAPAQWEGVAPALVGAHQRMNAALAAEVAATLAETFLLTKAQLAQGIAQAVWPGRLQLLTHGPQVEAWRAHGAVMLDGGHNAHAAAALAAWIQEQAVPVIVLCGLMRRKEAADFLAPLRAVAAQLWFVPIPGADDAYTPQELLALAPEAHMADTCEEAIAALHDVGNATLLIAGSLYLAGEILKTHG